MRVAVELNSSSLLWIFVALADPLHPCASYQYRIVPHRHPKRYVLSTRRQPTPLVIRVRFRRLKNRSHPTLLARLTRILRRSGAIGSAEFSGSA